VAIFALLSGMLTLYYELKGVEQWKRARREITYAVLIGAILLWLFFGGATPLIFWGGIAFWIVFSALAFVLERQARRVAAGQIYCPRCGAPNTPAAVCHVCHLPLTQIHEIVQANAHQPDLS
jgi:hypothetical protein